MSFPNKVPKLYGIINLNAIRTNYIINTVENQSVKIILFNKFIL
jgi:hypothetical protein